MCQKNKTIIVFLGPSGSGKSKLGDELRNYNIPKLVSDTSRKIRINDSEKDGVNYHFKSKEEILSSEMVEFTEYDGEIYGLSFREVQEKLNDFDAVYAITEINGVKSLRKKFQNKLNIKVIFLKISPKTSRERMRLRGDSEETINRRLRNAEINNEYDNYKYADYIIDNDGSFEESKKKLLEIVLNKSIL